MNPPRGTPDSSKQSNLACDNTSSLEAWDAPQLISLDLGAAQAKFCRFNNEAAPDNGPKIAGCSS